MYRPALPHTKDLLVDSHFDNKNKIFSSAKPRYALVADALIADIDSGSYPIGSTLPSELEISQKFGISRHTTREAMRRLEEMGMITRRPGVGTIVKRQSAQSHYTAAIADLSDLVHHTKHTHLQVLHQGWREMDASLGEGFADAVGHQWWCMETLRHPDAGGPPISYTEILLHPIYESLKGRMEEQGATVYRLIEESNGERIKELRQEISCTAATPEQAKLLGITAGEPVLRVLRYYFGRSDILLSVSINVYPSDRFNITTRWCLNNDVE